MHSKLLLASTFGAAAAFQAPAASKATSSLKAVYNPSSFDDVQSLPGILEPTGFFDPAGFSEGVSSSELKRYREAELTHGRVAMLASIGFLVGESGATPLFQGKIDGIAINQFWQVPGGFWPVILLFIAVPETFRALRGWMEPTVPENYFQLRPGYTPGDLDFDPLGLKPEDPEALKEMQTKESRAASKTTTLLFVCVASMAWITRCFVCCGCLSVAYVASVAARLCVVVVCRGSRVAAR
jgi:hypothetical protein